MTLLFVVSFLCQPIGFGDSPLCYPFVLGTVPVLVCLQKNTKLKHHHTGRLFAHFRSAFSATPKTSLRLSDKSFGAMTVPTCWLRIGCLTVTTMRGLSRK